MIADPLEVRIGQVLRQRSLKLAVAESCTGGLISHLITNVPGSSEYFVAGIMAYSYEAKETLLGVRHATLLEHGAVSRETVLEMARGVRRVLAQAHPPETVIGLSVSGIAGPGGGMPNKPVGLVWIGLSTPDGDWTRTFTWHGSRVENKALTAQAALDLALDYLQGKLH